MFIKCIIFILNILICCCFFKVAIYFKKLRQDSVCYHLLCLQAQCEVAGNPLMFWMDQKKSLLSVGKCLVSGSAKMTYRRWVDAQWLIPEVHKYCLQGTREDRQIRRRRRNKHCIACTLSPWKTFLIEVYFFSTFWFLISNSKHETWSRGVSGSWNLFFESLVRAAQICVCDVPWRCDQEYDGQSAGRCEYINF